MSLSISESVDQFIASEQIHQCDLEEFRNAIERLTAFHTRLEAEQVEMKQVSGACNLNAGTGSEIGSSPASHHTPRKVNST